MNYSYLFYNDFPKGIKSICVGDKVLSKEEFLKQKNEYFQRSKKQSINADK
jgi:hypothetical protein